MATPNGSLVPGRSRSVRSVPVRADEPSPAETYGFALAALAAAVVTLVFDHHGPVTVAMLTLALVPWALIVGGVRLPVWLFVVGTMAPAAEIVVVEDVGGPIFIAIYAVARVFSITRSLPARLATVAAAVVMAVAYGIVQNEPLSDSGVMYFVVGIGVGALAGYQLHRQRELTAELRWTYDRLNAAAAAEERRRVAREVHDVVAHSLTVVMLNVSGARKALARHPELAAEALDRAEQVGRESLDGVRRVVGLLREGDEQVAAPPVPTAADLHSIVEQQRQAGADIALDVRGDLDTVEPLTGAALARITQESLTNAQRHAPGAPIRVDVSVTGERVTLVIANGPPERRPLDARSERQGLGLLGMRERVEALGGAFAAGPAADGWRVTGSIPVAPRPAPAPASDIGR